MNVALSGSSSALLGGIVAFDYFGSIQRSAAMGKIDGSSVSMAGGIIGLVQGGAALSTVTENWSAMRVSGNMVGGLVGEADGNVTLADNYTSGIVAAAAA